MPATARRSADLAVVGAGVVGLSAAFHAAQRSLGRVLVLDREGVGAGASGVQPGGVRQQWATTVNCVLARRSLAFYRDLRARLQPRVDPRFRPCGYLFAAETDGTLERLAAEVALQNRVGVPSALLSPKEAAAVVPGLRADAIVGASFCAEDGFFDRPQAVVEAFAEAARRRGVAIERAEVVAIEPGRPSCRLLLESGRAVEAERVVVAAGVATRALLEPLGVDLPIEAEPRYLFLGDPIVERVLEPLVVAPDRGFAAKQLADGRLLASDLGAAGDPERDRERWRASVREAVLALLPHLEFVPLPLLVGGTYDVTPDRQAIVGSLPAHDGLLAAAGFSGHGFMIAPEVGRALAALAAGHDPGRPFDELRPERFARGRLVPEARVV